MTDDDERVRTSSSSSLPAWAEFAATLTPDELASIPPSNPVVRRPKIDVDSDRVQRRSLRDDNGLIDDGFAGSQEQFSREQLEVCRECGKPLDLSRDDSGNALRSPGGQPQYCSAHCKQQQRNAKRRKLRAKPVPPPQERLPTGLPAPWMVPCWAADPWLKFWIKGSVPIGRGRDTTYSDPTGNYAAYRVDRTERIRRCGEDPLDVCDETHLDTLPNMVA